MQERYKKHPTLSVEVSFLGDIRSMDRIQHRANGLWHYKGKKLKKFPQSTNKSKILYEKVHIGSRNYWVHRLVAETWVKNLQGLKYVNHKDGDGLNNRADNLEWCENGYNVIDAIKRGAFGGIKYINGKPMSFISRELGDSLGHLVSARLRKGWCIDCAISIPKMGMGGNHREPVCKHREKHKLSKNL